MTVTHVKYRATKPLVIILSYCLVLLYSGALKLCMLTLHVVQRKRRLCLPGELFLRKLDSNSEHKETNICPVICVGKFHFIFKSLLLDPPKCLDLC